MAEAGARSGTVAHMIMHAPLPDRWAPLTQKISVFFSAMTRSHEGSSLPPEKPLPPLPTYVNGVSSCWGPPSARPPKERVRLG